MGKKIENLLRNKRDTVLNATELAAAAAFFRLTIFDILHARQTGHWGGSSSAAEIVTALYFHRLKINPSKPDWDKRDRFILSKGHASLCLYTILANRGFFPAEELPKFRTYGSRLQGHPCMRKLPGIDMSTGALGHGLSISVGMALASKLSGENFGTYVLSGEGCLDEGSTWEALLYGAKTKPHGLVYLIDYNKVQLDGNIDDILPLEPLADKIKSFGWHLAPKRYDGNDSAAILEAFKWIDSDGIWPKAVIFDTVKGKGVSFMEGKNSWHGAPIDDDSYNKGRLELLADLEKKEAAL
ncbi:MAG: transketolase [Spirochaetaceae bacterium]|jgi:transketolase|nr:transketolase [Spirochaetaceae bacterium]